MNIIKWLKESNRWKHLVGGVLLGIASDNVYCAALVGVSVSSALEFKDMSWGGKWDWLDWVCTVVGTAIGYIIHFVVFKIICL